MATTTKDAVSPDDLKTATPDCKRLLKVSNAELDGIREILANPEPPSSEMIAQWQDYLRHAADNSNSGW